MFGKELIDIVNDGLESLGLNDWIFNMPALLSLRVRNIEFSLRFSRIL